MQIAGVASHRPPTPVRRPLKALHRDRAARSPLDPDPLVVSSLHRCYCQRLPLAAA